LGKKYRGAGWVSPIGVGLGRDFFEVYVVIKSVRRWLSFAEFFSDPGLSLWAFCFFTQRAWPRASRQCRVYQLRWPCNEKALQLL